MASSQGTVYSENRRLGTRVETNMDHGKRKRILSGVQPSGKLHLGNYFGAIKQHIALQEENECFYFIANYHALTTSRDAAQKFAAEMKIKIGAADVLRQNTID